MVSAAALAALLGGCAPQQSSGTTRRPVLNKEVTRQYEVVTELALRLQSGRGVARDLPTAAKLTEEQAIQTGLPFLQYQTGENYLAGFGVDANAERAVPWLLEAAQQNFPSAQAELSFLYAQGRGVARDDAQAVKLARAAADRDNVLGYIALGDLYARGQGVEKDEAQAAKLFRRAADKRYAPAQWRLADAYQAGKGVPADGVLAYAWFAIAAAGNATDSTRAASIKGRDDLALVLLPPDLELGRRLAADWKPGADMDSLRSQYATSGAAPATPVSAPPSTPAPQAKVPVAADDSRVAPADLSAVRKVRTSDYEVQPDGSYTLTIHSEVLVRNESLIQQIGESRLSFNESMEQLDIVEAYTQKADGRKLPVDPGRIQIQAAPDQKNSIFSDQKQKVILFPSVRPGDTVVFTAKYTTKPYIPGLFSLSLPFNPLVAEDDARITISAPRTLPIAVETHDVTFQKREEGDRAIYEWRYANPLPLKEYNIALDPMDRSPRLFASTFRNYEQLARVSYGQIEPKMQVTPQVQKLADEITAGVSGKRRQAELIHNWVSQHIRYVGIILGTEGAFVPHDVDTILANGYGDCKDHSAVFGALLKAKGIASEMVFINLGNSYALSGPPTFGSLNHAITYLPDFNVYTDTTASVAPFGMLPFGEYGKPVVHVAPSGQAVRRTPVLAPNVATVASKSTVRLDAEGKLTGTSEIVATGPFAIDLRQAAMNIQAGGSEDAARYLLQQQGYTGSGRFDIADTALEKTPFKITGRFETRPRRELVGGNSFALPWGLAFGWRPGNDLLGPLEFRDARVEPTACFSGREVQELSLELPAGKRVRDLPKGLVSSNKYGSFKSEWSVAGRIVTQRREFVVTIDEAVCLGDARRQAIRLTNEINADYNAGAIALVDE